MGEGKPDGGINLLTENQICTTLAGPSWRPGQPQGHSTSSFVSSGCGNEELRGDGTSAMASPHHFPSCLGSGATRGLSLTNGCFLAVIANILPVPFTCLGTTEELVLSRCGFDLARSKSSTHYSYSLWGKLDKADTLEVSL